jgi:hypothetical protein
VPRAAARENPRQPPTYWFNTKRLTIHYSSRVSGHAGLSAAELWQTQDGGSTWNKCTENDGKHGFTIDVPNDGRYGFILVLRSGEALSRERPAPGARPDIWVEVHTIPPVVQLFAPEFQPGADGDNLLITWNAQGQNLAAQPISLYYSESGKRPWTPIAIGVANTGRYVWEAPPDFPEQAWLRLQVANRAGTYAAVERAIQHIPARVQLEGKIFRVEPADGRSP